MKLLQVNAYQVALLFRKGAYTRMLQAGTYLLWNEDAIVYEMNKPFVALVELNILLRDEALAALLEVVEVKDNEIALQYEDGLLKQVLNAGRYAYWKGIINHAFVKADISKIEITEAIERATLQHRLVVPFVRTITVENYEKAVLLVDGKYNQLLAPGVYYFWKNAAIISMAKVDMRVLQMEINGQEILTKDKAALRINAWAQYQVTNAEKALLENKEYDKQLYVAFQLALREYVAAFSFDELLDKKDSIAPVVLQAVQDKAAALGMVVISFGIRDIILPGDVKDIMNQVLIAEKKAQANTIMRREETASTRSLLNTAKLMEDNAMLWKLKEMEYVEKIADKINTISVSGNTALMDQLKQIFSVQK